MRQVIFVVLLKIYKIKKIPHESDGKDPGEFRKCIEKELFKFKSSAEIKPINGAYLSALNEVCKEKTCEPEAVRTITNMASPDVNYNSRPPRSRDESRKTYSQEVIILSGEEEEEELRLTVENKEKN